MFGITVVIDSLRAASQVGKNKPAARIDEF
jgi:hypothetical protein